MTQHFLSVKERQLKHLSHPILGLQAPKKFYPALLCGRNLKEDRCSCGDTDGKIETETELEFAIFE